MKTICSIMLAFALMCGQAFSQVATERKAGFQFGLFPPLSTNGLHSYRYTNDVSLNLLVGLSKNENVLTVGGLANVVTNEANGFQLAGLVNIAGKESRGVQFAGLANTSKHHAGFQFAGVINVSGDVKGMQWAGLVNKARNVIGVQWAGLINIAENSDYPIGLINLIRHGEKSIAITYNETGSVVTTFRSGGRFLYGIVGIGYNHKTSGRSYVTEAGFGAHIYCLSRIRIHNELKLSCFGYSNNPLIIENDHLRHTVFHISYSMLPAIRLSPHFELFGGPSLCYMNAGKTNERLVSYRNLWQHTGISRSQQIYIGYQAGIHYIF